MKNFLAIYTSTIILIIALSIFYYEKKTTEKENKGGFDMAVLNYKQDVDSIAEIFNLPTDYLMALIILESSGKKKVYSRFEKRIYKKLLLTKMGKISGFEQINAKTLKLYSKKEIKKLSCSYGPFQIMGYKSIGLKISLQSLIGENHLYWAIKWINGDYGDYLRKGEYKNAFHIHNAGKKYPDDGIPTTYDPKYVEKGLKYMKHFKNYKK
ncbi:MAG: hypothetical protein B6I20_07295 [Bacteroidetes bacterium 4572_117]|nr:MAG: hypothetical protein B6I20_07295 [Bacteroidetes bacterium 4572_117]